MHHDHIALGKRGESEAAAHLRRLGYRIAAKNVRAGGVEIDLIATKARIVAFVEVKTRSSQRYGAPEDAVDARKRERLIRGALAWLHEQAPRPWRKRCPTIRFDVIACTLQPDGNLHLRHIEAAFDAGD